MKNTDHDKNPLDNPQLKKSPFKVDGNYFGDLSERIANAVNAEESELKYNLHLKKSPFKTPTGYFDELPSRIQSKLSEDKKEVKFYQRPITRWLAVAASFALLLTIYLNKPSQTSTELLSSVSDEAIISFLESENALNEELLVNLEEIDSVLEAIYADETGIFVNALETNLELEYDFEYFDY